MKIAVLTTSYPRFSGDSAAPFIKSICEALVEAGNDVEVLAPYDPQICPYDTHGVRLNHFRYSLRKGWNIMGYGRALEGDVNLKPLAFVLLPFFIASSVLNLLKIIKRQGTDLIYVHWVLPNGLAGALAALFSRLPLLISLHGSDIFIARSNIFFRSVAEWVFHQATAVTACSAELREQAIHMGAPEATKLLAWGADPILFHPRKDKDEIRLKFGLTSQDIIIVALGRMVYKKGFDILLKSFQQVRAAEPRVKLIIGGDGALLQALQCMAQELGIVSSVLFPGKIAWDLVPQFLGMADIFILPSVRDPKGNIDGLPTVLLEAMGCGLAVIASDIGGVRLAVENEVNGLVVPPADIPALSAQMARLISNPSLRSGFGQAARQSVVELLNWQKVSSNLTALLQSAEDRLHHPD